MLLRWQKGPRSRRFCFKEVDPVIRALRRGGIEITAVHNHMLNEEPRIFFLHYWGTGLAEKLAGTIREAFDQAKEPLR